MLTQPVDLKQAAFFAIRLQSILINQFARDRTSTDSGEQIETDFIQLIMSLDQHKQIQIFSLL
jgi:hypothetical protein